MITKPVKIVVYVGSLVCALASGVMKYTIIENKRRQPFKSDAKKINI